MPITGPSSYVATTEQFRVHWELVNNALSDSGPLLLAGGKTVEDFTTMREELMSQRTKVEDEAMDLQLARAALLAKKLVLRDWLFAFRTRVIAVAGTSVYSQTLPLVPGVNDGPDSFTKPMKQAAHLWSKLNTSGLPGMPLLILLYGGVNQSEFAAAVEEIEVLFDALTAAETDVAFAIQQRNDVQDTIYAMMKLYRQTVPAYVPAGSALLDSLPGLTATGGRTPEPVAASGEWEPEFQQARVTSGLSDDPELDHYELRACAGPEYSTELESVAGSQPPGDAVAFTTTKFLLTDGAVASYRVYVILTTGHEAGSNTVVVARP